MSKISDRVEFYIHGTQVTANGVVYDFIEEQRLDIEALHQQVEQLTETISLLTTEGENRLQAIKQLTQERDELEYRCSITHAVKTAAQAQKYREALEKIQKESHEADMRDPVNADYVFRLIAAMAQEALQKVTEVKGESKKDMVLVPREPPFEVVRIGCDSFREYPSESRYNQIKMVYKAMIKAAEGTQ